jgi:hypothetical protein
MDIAGKSLSTRIGGLDEDGLIELPEQWNEYLAVFSFMARCARKAGTLWRGAFTPERGISAGGARRAPFMISAAGLARFSDLGRDTA